LLVELVAEEERRRLQLIEFGTNGSDDTRPFDALISSESDERTGVRNDGHSELLDGVELPLQLLTLELEVWDALFRGVTNELETEGWSQPE
jgi:hypothetical protein